ncbi:MAG: hypothetical protein RR387_07175, partial [Clostridiales bacterium]
MASFKLGAFTTLIGMGGTFLVLIVLFTLLARRIDWSEVFDTLGDFKLRTLLIAGALTLCSFLVYS